MELVKDSRMAVETRPTPMQDGVELVDWLSLMTEVAEVSNKRYSFSRTFWWKMISFWSQKLTFVEDFWLLFFLVFHCFLQYLNLVFFSIVRHASTQRRNPAHRVMASQHLQTFEKISWFYCIRFGLEKLWEVYLKISTPDTLQTNICNGMTDKFELKVYTISFSLY